MRKRMSYALIARRRRGRAVTGDVSVEGQIRDAILSAARTLGVDAAAFDSHIKTAAALLEDYDGPCVTLLRRAHDHLVTVRVELLRGGVL